MVLAMILQIQVAAGLVGAPKLSEDYHPVCKEHCNYHDASGCNMPGSVWALNEGCVYTYPSK